MNQMVENGLTVQIANIVCNFIRIEKENSRDVNEDVVVKVDQQNL